MSNDRGQGYLAGASLRRAALGTAVCVVPCAALAAAGVFLEGLALAAAVGFISAAGLVAIGCVLWRAGQRNGRAVDSQGGVAMLEFAMVLPIGLILALLMVQSSLLMVGNLCVNYSAYCAARCAIVTVPLDLSDSEPHNVVAFGGSSGKIERIRQATVWAVMPVSCSAPEIVPEDAGDLQQGLDDLFGVYGLETPSWVGRQLRHKLGYADRHTSIDLEPPANGDVYGDNEDLTVTAVHTFYLAVPYASWLFAIMDSKNAVDLGFVGADEYGLVIRATSVLTNEGVADFIEPETFPG